MHYNHTSYVTDVPWIVDPDQDGAQLDPTEVSPSDDATMVEPEANLEKKELREFMQPPGQSDTYLGELVELNLSDNYISELDELSDTSLELNELSDIEDGAGLVLRCLKLIKEGFSVSLKSVSFVTTLWRCGKSPQGRQQVYSRTQSQRSKSIDRDYKPQERENDAPWIVDPGQDGAQLDPTEVSPSDDATMVEPEANLEKKGLREWMQPYGCISVDATPMEGTKWKQQSIDLEDIMELDTHEHFGRVRRSDTYLGELVELNQSDTYISELDELSELSDSSLELNELSDTKDGAGLVSGRNGMKKLSVPLVSPVNPYVLPLGSSYPLSPIE
ncbi:hypothetical protein YC2023_033316 [Brassica napus]